ncbi:tellurite resistance TerB family protein [Microbulbifer bruguierae]|uniref:Tellurite resistance TerB family protein n=1 Tax=Microbulbifer bruguierae TaxID=3029061 RepID=A0ABY8NEX6_9GAMM|nr:tellurite resistance TerB family protein [Microbulbifer bruguierae]WGL17483.1 tellurite resistance TerB family protein [Microbulbifer bruguierae]
MNKKLLLGALIGAGISMLNKKIRAQSAPAPGKPPPDFSKVPAPDTSDGPNLDDILARASKPGGLGGGWQGQSPGGAQGVPTGPGSGDIFGGAIPAGAGAGGAAVLMEIARRIFAQMQQQGPGGIPGGTPGGIPSGDGAGGGMSGGGGLGDILGQIFGRADGKFGQQGPQGSQTKPGNWGQMKPRGKGGLFGFVNTDTDADDDEQQAETMLKAMIAAAQADGKIDPQEQENIMQALHGQVDSSELETFRTMLTTPVDLDQVVEGVNDPATAFNLYLVSAMTINPDNTRERQYLEELAQKLGMSEQAARVIEQQIPRG